MKLNKKLFVLAGLTLLGGLLTGCTTGEKYDSNGVIQVDGDVYAISSTDKTLSYVAVNEEVDLDEYFQVVMDDADSSITHKYTVFCDDEKVTIDGHKVKASEVGEYELKLAVNDKDKYITLSVKSAYNMKLINFFAKFEESDGKNYRLDIGEYDDDNGEWTYGNETIIHNPNYVAAFDAEDVGAVDKDGESESFIIANLSDGNGYFGYFDADEKPVFQNGKVSMDNYYIGGSLILDGGSFTSVIDDVSGKEILIGGATEVRKLLNYGVSSFPDRSGYTENSFYVLDLVDEDGDGETDALYARLTVDGPGTDGTIYTDQEWCSVKISEVGSCTWDSLEVAIKNDSYVPAKISSPEIAVAFKSIIEQANYTTTMKIYACDENGDALDIGDISDTSAMYYFLGTKSAIKEENTITSATDIETVAYLDDELVSSAAYWKDEDGKYYMGTYSAATTDKDGKEVPEEITKTEDAKGKSLSLFKTYMADNVDLDTIDDVDWSQKLTEGDYVFYAGNVGDNVGGVQTNGFFAGLFDQMSCLNGIGTYLTKDGGVSYTDGSTGSLTFAATYSLVSVNTSTNEIVVNALVGLPFSDIDQPYIMFEYAVSEIGTTTNDFSSYDNVTATVA